MPRTGPRRKAVGVKLSDDGRAYIEELAAKEADGNLSEMIRILLKEALAARTKKEKRR